MKIVLFTILLLVSSSSFASCVILLHGLARSPDSMNKLDESLSQTGFTVVNQGYPSRDFPIELLAEKAITPALAQCPKDAKVSFVTHSLGGILVRQYLSTTDIEQLHRVVMLGPPNKGSEVVDKLAKVPGFEFINGQAGLQLGTGELSVPNQLGNADFDLGIIAGTRSINLILSQLIPGTDDGKVSIESTKLEGMNAHLVMPVTHPFMMKNKQVIKQVIHYLQHGSFITAEGQKQD
ncbi:alpha/beta hydrolase [Endozoicomonas sp. G2_1]|uniref:esterase/lipase family protein n=1 Tax=Endozoicomonas sp. G2_1 TaxID=2821091 RepID=UPI001ADCBF70|nr:alpha/beta hydrolase [Endozoicomonas sp. G2_1]MBO9491979.1 alpha/beta hydrolase [Endozoicomonas sp. G2_1]